MIHKLNLTIEIEKSKDNFYYFEYLYIIKSINTELLNYLPIEFVPYMNTYYNNTNYNNKVLISKIFLIMNIKNKNKIQPLRNLDGVHINSMIERFICNIYRD